MTFDKAVKNIGRSLVRKHPISFDYLWIKRNCRTTYFFIAENIKTELDEADWDLVVSRLDRDLQKRWMKGRKQPKCLSAAYEDNAEVEVILKKHQDKLYTFVAQESAEDRVVCDWISIRLVRVAQKGNLLARSKVVTFVGYLIDQWIERNVKFARWRGNTDLIQEKTEGCICRFRYVGSFIGYLYRTFEYSGRALSGGEAYSLDECYSGTVKRKIDDTVYDDETGMAKMNK